LISKSIMRRHPGKINEAKKDGLPTSSRMGEAMRAAAALAADTLGRRIRQRESFSHDIAAGMSR
jgi:hypothetical protein